MNEYPQWCDTIRVTQSCVHAIPGKMVHISMDIAIVDVRSLVIASSEMRYLILTCLACGMCSHKRSQ